MLQTEGAQGFIRVKAYGDFSPSIDKPYNRPAFAEGFSGEDYEREYLGVYNQMRDRLEIFGKVSIERGGDGISLGPPAHSSRKIGIVLDAEECFRPELIHAIQAVLKGIDQDYFVYIDGEYAPGKEGFYICITRDKVKGYAEKAAALEPFGFLA